LGFAILPKNRAKIIVSPDLDWTGKSVLWVWCARDIVGDEPFTVLLADDLIQSEVPLLYQMIKEFDRLRATIVAAVEVPKEDTSRYGILETEPGYNGTSSIHSMVEKPKP
jgi:UTP--glucose-1-phosphate uridylyltransferase